MDGISVGMTKAGWEKVLAEAKAELDKAKPGFFDWTFYANENGGMGKQVGITFSDDDMVAGREERTDEECYVEVT